MGVSTPLGRGEDRRQQFQPDAHRDLCALLPAGEPHQACDPDQRGGPGQLDASSARTGQNQVLNVYETGQHSPARPKKGLYRLLEKN